MAIQALTKEGDSITCSEHYPAADAKSCEGKRVSFSASDLLGVPEVAEMSGPAGVGAEARGRLDGYVRGRVVCLRLLTWRRLRDFKGVHDVFKVSLVDHVRVKLLIWYSSRDNISAAPESHVERRPSIKDAGARTEDLEKGNHRSIEVDRENASRHSGDSSYRRRDSRRRFRDDRDLAREGSATPGIEASSDDGWAFREEVITLQVFDASFDPSSEIKLRLTCEGWTHLAQCLGSLPEQEPRSVRMLLCNLECQRPDRGSSLLSENSPFLYDRALNSYLCELGIEDKGWPTKAEISDISMLAPQWREMRKSAWVGISSFDLDERNPAFMKCLPIGTDKLVVLYFINTNIGKRETSFYSALCRLFCKGSSLQQSNGTRKEVAKLLVLDFLRFALRFSTEAVMDRVRSVQDEYLSSPQDIDYEVVNSHNLECSRYETHGDAAQDLVDAAEFVISSIVNGRTGSIGDVSSNSGNAIPIPLQELFEEVRGSCAQLQKLVGRIQAFNQRRYDLYLSTLNIHESQSVKRLSALATGFLPLSLGATLLSMQTRFVDLGYLLYDFVGVGLLLFFSMGMVLLLLKLLLRTTNWKPFARKWPSIMNGEISLEEAKKQWIKLLIHKAVSWGILAALSAFILASFLVGMLDNVPLGLKVLGYGIAAFFGLLVGILLLIVAAIAIFFASASVLLRLGFFKKRSSRRDSRTPTLSDDGSERPASVGT